MIKFYFNISTKEYIGKVTGGESWNQGDIGNEAYFYFGTGTTTSFTNGLTSTTLYDYSGRVTVTRADGTENTFSLSQIVDGADIYYKIVDSDGYISNVAGITFLDVQRYDDSTTLAYDTATQIIGEGDPTPEDGYVTTVELQAVDDKVDLNTANKHNKDAIVTTTAEGTPAVDTDVYSKLKADEVFTTQTEKENILDGTTEFSEVNIGGCEVTYDESCRVLEADLGNDVVLQIGEENFICATNKSGAAVSTPTVCEITGSTGNKLQFEVASNDGTPTGNLALATETISNNASGKLTHFGLIRNVDTTAIVGSPIEGAVIYLGTNGGLTTIKPEAPNAIIRIGNIVTANATVGVIFVDIQRAGKFANQSDVYFNGGLSDGDLAQYVEANTRWEAINKANITVGKATADASGNTITTTYATKTELETAVTGLYDYKGTVATYADLPSSGQETGDVYNVTNDENTGGEGVNYAWTGTEWDNIGGAETTKVDKDLSGYVAKTNLVDDDLFYISDSENSYGNKKTTYKNIKDQIIIDGDVFDDATDYASEGLGAYKTAFDTIHQMALESTGKYYVDVKDIGDNLWAVIEMPDTSTDTATTTQLSFDNKVTYRTLKINGNNIASADLSEKILQIYRNGTTLILNDDIALTDQLTFSKVIDSTYGQTNPIKGVSKFIEADSVSLEQSVSNGDSPTTSNFSNNNLSYSAGIWTENNISSSIRIYQSGFTISGIKYFVTGEVKRSIGGTSYLSIGGVSGSNVTVGANEWTKISEVLTTTSTLSLSFYSLVTQGSGETFEFRNVMAIPITNTPLASESADTIANRITGLYWESRKDTVNPKWITRGNNLFDYVNVGYEEVDDTITTFIDEGIRVKSDGTGGFDNNLTITPIKVKTNTDYYISFFGTLVSGTDNCRILVTDNTRNTSTGVLLNVIGNGNQGGTFNTGDSEEIYIAFYVTNGTSSVQIKEFTNIMLNEGTTALDYEEYNEGYLELIGTGYSAGASQDKFIETETGYAIQRYNGRDYNDVVQSATGWIVDAELTNTIRFSKDLTGELNYKLKDINDISNVKIIIDDITINAIYSVDDMTSIDVESIGTRDGNSRLYIRILKSKLSGITSADFEAYLQANDVEFIYELDSLEAPEDIEYNGTPIQEEITTIIQSNDNVAIDTTFEFNVDKSAQIVTNAENTRKNRKDIDDLEVNKVDKDGDKVLSDNNYDDTDKDKVDYLTVTESIDLDTTVKAKVLFSGNQNVSSSTSKPATKQITLSESATNFDYIEVHWDYSNTSYGSKKIPSEHVGVQQVCGWQHNANDSGEGRMSFYIQIVSNTDVFLWGGRFVSMTYSATATETTRTANTGIYISRIIGYKFI